MSTTKSNRIQMAPGVTMEQSGDTLTLHMDTTQDLGLSKSGKTHVVATTRGFVTLPNGQRLSLNLIRDRAVGEADE